MNQLRLVTFLGFLTKIKSHKIFPSSSVPSNESTSDVETRKLSADSSKSELENDLSPPPLEEIDHAPSPTASSCSDYEQHSPRILQPTQNNTSGKYKITFMSDI